MSSRDRAPSLIKNEISLFVSLNKSAAVVSNASCTMLTEAIMYNAEYSSICTGGPNGEKRPCRKFEPGFLWPHLLWTPRNSPLPLLLDTRGGEKREGAEMGQF